MKSLRSATIYLRLVEIERERAEIVGMCVYVCEKKKETVCVISKRVKLGKRERERETECVCVCVSCVCELCVFV